MMVYTGCKKRWCPVCGPKITAKRYTKVAPIASRMKWPLSVMLSMKNPKEVAGSVATLAEAFRGFRRTRFWKDRVKGGIVGYEMTHKGNGCHVHLHALVDCRWLAVATPEPTRRHTESERARLCELAQAELSAVWAGYLGQAQAVVWVRRADKQALAETIKYPFKPADFRKLKCRLSDIIDEIDAGRRVASFGNCHATSKCFLGRDEIIRNPVPCKRCKVVDSIVPVEVEQRWARGAGRPGAKARAAMEWDWDKEHGTYPVGEWILCPDGVRRHRDDGDAIPW